jgi:hypothetical protein
VPIVAGIYPFDLMQGTIREFWMSIIAIWLAKICILVNHLGVSARFHRG